MKPSDEIKNKMAEFMVKDGKDPNNGLITYYESAILEYLDEQYKKNNPKCFCKTLGCDKNEHTYKAEVV